MLRSSTKASKSDGWNDFKRVLATLAAAGAGWPGVESGEGGKSSRVSVAKRIRDSTSFRCRIISAWNRAISLFRASWDDD